MLLGTIEGLSLDAIVDPILARLRSEWLNSQRFAVRLLLDPVLEALEALPLDQYAEEAARRAMEAIRAAVEEWFAGPQTQSLGMFVASRTSKDELAALHRAGIEPARLLLGLNELPKAVHGLAPMLKPIAKLTTNDAGESVEETAFVLDCGDTALERLLIQGVAEGATKEPCCGPGEACSSQDCTGTPAQEPNAEGPGTTPEVSGTDAPADNAV